MSSPSGLDAWSLTQLGWVKPDEVVLGPRAITFRIMALETKSGTRVVKFSLQEDLYYLLELRLRREVDIDLSTEAVLVSLINRTALSGYDGYGVVNSTALLTSNLGRTQKKPILLKTDDKGEIRYTLTLYSLGRHRVSLNVTGIMWPRCLSES
jgi:hypothetical protein